MAEVKEQFNNTNGIENAAESDKYDPSVCIQASDYHYTATDSEVNNKYYLKGSSSDSPKNAFGGSYAYFYWGQAGKLASVYGTAFKFFESGDVNYVPFVYKNYGLLPIKSTLSSAVSPFTISKKFISQVQFRYNRSSDKCQYKFPDFSAWVDLNDGPGIFFIMTGGGGAGGNAKSTWGIGYTGIGGSGGGGGASCIGYIDLRYLNGIIVFEPGSAGIYTTDMSSTGGDGGESYFRRLNSASHLLSCPGGHGGKGAGGNGGSGGELPTNNSNYIHLFNSFIGKTGGIGTKTTTGNNGESFDTNITLSPSGEWSFMKTTYIPLENNGVYGNGSNYYNTTPSGYAECTAAGGGGGSSILSTPSASASDYGSGGHGGNARTGKLLSDNDGWWDKGVSGTRGALYILNISL